MSTTQDVKNARQGYEDHVAAHKCRSGDGCPVRLMLWRVYVGDSRNSVAARWNEDQTA